MGTIPRRLLPFLMRLLKKRPTGSPHWGKNCRKLREDVHPRVCAGINLHGCQPKTLRKLVVRDGNCP